MNRDDQMKLEVEERDDIRPVCPHCDTELDTVRSKELSGAFGKRYIYFCAHCSKVLGVSHRKGFWMG